MKVLRLLALVVVVAVAFTSCELQSHSMKQPNNIVEFKKDDFKYSPQVTGEATSTQILMIDWARLFSKKMGEAPEAGVMEIPVIGNLIANKVNNYALFNIMQDNPGYDVVFYPSFETKTKNYLYLYKVTTVKVTARLAKIKD